MKAAEYPMKSNLFKNFDKTAVVRYSDLTEEEKEYEVVDIVFQGNSHACNVYKVVIIASPETMKAFNLKPRFYRITDK